MSTVNMHDLSYPIERKVGPPNHGNTSSGLPFREMQVGDAFYVDAEDYTRASSARAYFYKWYENTYPRRTKRPVIKSAIERMEDGTVQYKFWRER